MTEIYDIKKVALLDYSGIRPESVREYNGRAVFSYRSGDEEEIGEIMGLLDQDGISVSLGSYLDCERKMKDMAMRVSPKREGRR